jgi:hypothetical protein
METLSAVRRECYLANDEDQRRGGANAPPPAEDELLSANPIHEFAII